MPGITLPPDAAAVVGGQGGVVARTERIERQTNVPCSPGLFEIVFSYPGLLSNDVVSPAWYPPGVGSVRVVRINLVANATSDHVIEIGIGGTPIQQFTLPSGDQTIMLDANIEILTSYVTVKTISVTDSDLSVQLGIG